MFDDKNVDRALKYVCPKLNALDIDYYVVGAVGAYLSLGVDSGRVHDDLDILIDEKYVDLLEGVFKDGEYAFCDNRYYSDKTLNEKNYTDGKHEVIAEAKDSDFHIGFFLFSKTDTQYTITEYFRDGDKQLKLERTLPIKYFKYQYDDEPILYNGVEFKTVTPECIYKNKLGMNREKDKYDRGILSNFLDAERLDYLSGMSKERVTSIKEV